MKQSEIEPQKQKKVNCIQIHNMKPFVAYGQQQGKGCKVIQVKEDGFKVNRILFLESHDSIATLVKLEDTNQTIMKIWKLDINNLSSIQGNTAQLAAKSHLKFNLIGLKYNQQVLVLVSLNKIYFFSLKKLQIIKIVEVIDNKKGMISMTVELKPGLAAIPDPVIGSFRILNMSSFEKSNLIKAHKSQITNIMITFSGLRVATTSFKATTVRIFSTRTKKLLQQIILHDCKDQILSIRFSWQTDWMVVCTKDGKLRVFVTKLTPQQNSQQNNILQLQNPKQALSFLSFLFQYFGRELPFAQFNAGQQVKGYLCTVKFQQQNDIVMAFTQTISQVSKAMVLRFDPINGGQLLMKSQVILQ